MATKAEPSTAPLKNYLAQAGDLPVEVLLGRIVFFTITDEAVKHSDVVKWFKTLKLDADFLPAENKALDAFKKATSDQDKHRYDLKDGREANVLTRNVNETTMLLRRQITREIRDGKIKALDYQGVIECVFSKPSNPSDQTGARLKLQVVRDNLVAGEFADVQAIAKAIQEKYYRYFQFLDGMKLRATVRTYLRKKLNAIEVKGGVYFVQAKYDEELQALAKLVAKFGGDCQMNAIPIVDLPRERKFLTQVLQREAGQELTEFTNEIQELMSSGRKISQATVARAQARYDQMASNMAEHMATLRLTKNVTAAGAELAQRELAKLTKAALKP